MTDLRHVEELIEKYLDELLTPEELAELEQCLTEDPEAARLFNEMAKTEQWIQRHFAGHTAEMSLQFDQEIQTVASGTPAVRRPSRAFWSWRLIRDHLWGPSGAVILHVLLLAAILRLVAITPPPPEDEYEFVLIEQNNVELPPDDTPPPLEPLPPHLQDPGLQDESYTPDDAPVDVEPPPAPEPVDLAGFDLPDQAPSRLILKDYAPGRSADGRARAMDEYAGGMGKLTEPAVLRALEWLKKNQGPDGSWGPNKPAMTGLALLTFLAHGETTASEAYGATVEKAIRFLLAQQQPGGSFCKLDQPGSYAHGIATYAISEAYGMTRIPSLKPVMEAAVQVILDGQQAGGGWDYGFSKTARRDTSVGGWQVQALKAALIAGAENPGLRDALDKAVHDVKSAFDTESGRFYYTDKGSHKTDSITGVAVLSLQLAGHGTSREARAGLQAIGSASCQWEKPPAWPMYAWYYITQARFHHGGAGWTRWNQQFARAYVKSQNEDGSWTSPGPKAGGSQGAETHLGPVYSTTLAALTLQVYYRFLPTYKAPSTEPSARQNTPGLAAEVF